MSAVTPGMRAAGWNVLFTIGPERDPCAFAGIYQVVGSDLVTFRDVCNELRLCFEFPNNVTRDESGNNGESGSNDDHPWDSIAFALADRSDLSPEMRGLSFVHGELLDEPVPSLPSTHPKRQDVLKYHIVLHKTCDILSSPGIQACHIVPQIQYHLYPSGDDITTTDTSPRGLIAAWEKTWSPDNGILLDKTLHELFDARLFSIHPTTFQVRTFVPYDKLIQYHGKKALIHPETDIKALRHHYEMCCIENMAARKPPLEEVPLPSTGTVPTRGRSRLDTATPSLPLTPGSEVGGTGDPSKKRAPNPNQSQSKGASGQNDLVEEAEARGYKRRRLECQVVDSQISPQPCYDSEDEDTLDGFITPWNSRDFLANVNWELRKFQALHRIN
ncbi:hypothetical protein GQX73_g6499 [Xylaria multiplex]|uniref:HNH nuclease domain-containing protein n=1 Tax=Xylaria multiplex TaxID=323545 RepID=A0A7C8IM18_9PEZI|nr:hypothetical protein GQX73_g6499 [Xylaria multiplex]